MLFSRKNRLLARVVIVEDEPLIAFDNERALSDEGFEIIGTFDHADAAIDLIEAEVPIDLVVADVSLAAGSGVDVARAAAARAIRVLFVTADCPVEAQTLAAGWLAKPYQQRDLIAALDVIEALASGAEPRKLPSGLSLFGRG